jgi:hypothetical protein
MKIRNGFVSNSSSSSFVIRKSALNKEKLDELLKILNKYNNTFETEFIENDKYISGYLESHNHCFFGENDEGDYDDQTAFKMVDDFINEIGLTEKDYLTEYCGDVASLIDEMEKTK